MIHLPPGASPVLMFAREELQRYASQLTGMEVFIGPSHWAAQVGDWDLRRMPGNDDGYRVVGSGKRWLLTSKSERGCLTAAYALLQEMGMRWPHPGLVQPVTERLPAIAMLEAEPAYEIRGTALAGPTTTDEVLTLVQWSARRGLNAVWVQQPEGIDLDTVRRAVQVRAMELTVGELPHSPTSGRCFQHSLGNPYRCQTNPSLFGAVAGGAVGIEPYADLMALGRPANLATVIRQDLEDYFRESFRAFYMVQNGPLSWWTCGFNFDVYARTLWDLNTDVAEALVDFARGDEQTERMCGRAEEAAAVALTGCLSAADRVAAVRRTADMLCPASLEQYLHLGDWAAAVAVLERMDDERLGRFGRDIYLPLLRDRVGAEGVS